MRRLILFSLLPLLASTAAAIDFTDSAAIALDAGSSARNAVVAHDHRSGVSQGRAYVAYVGTAADGISHIFATVEQTPGGSDFLAPGQISTTTGPHNNPALNVDAQGIARNANNERVSIINASLGARVAEVTDTLDSRAKHFEEVA